MGEPTTNTEKKRLREDEQEPEQTNKVYSDDELDDLLPSEGYEVIHSPEIKTKAETETETKTNEAKESEQIK